MKPRIKVITLGVDDLQRSLAFTDAARERFWGGYSRTRWNHVRTAAALAAAVLFTLAL